MTPKPILELKNIFGKAVRNLSLKVYPSERIVLLGPSGSGKTTLLRYMNYLNAPDKGQIIFHGKSIDEYSIPSIRKKDILLPQTPVVVDGSVLDNIKWAYSLNHKVEDRSEEDYLECLRIVGIEHLCESPAQRLSIGEKQRLNLAMGFSLRPELMLLDEPTSALDPSASEEVRKVINRLNGTGISFVIVTHNFYEAIALADKIGIMIDGELIQFGTRDDVLENPINKKVSNFIDSHRRENA